MTEDVKKVLREYLPSLSLGATFDMGTLFPPLTAQKLKWELVEKDNSGMFEFVTSYFGVFFASYKITVKGDLITVKEV